MGQARHSGMLGVSGICITGKLAALTAGSDLVRDLQCLELTSYPTSRKGCHSTHPTSHIQPGNSSSFLLPKWQCPISDSQGSATATVWSIFLCKWNQGNWDSYNESLTMLAFVHTSGKYTLSCFLRMGWGESCTQGQQLSFSQGWWGTKRCLNTRMLSKMSAR